MTQPAEVVTGRPGPFGPRLRWLFPGVWLVFLADAFGLAWRRLPDPAGALALAALVGFCVVYIVAFTRIQSIRQVTGGAVAPRGVALLTGMAGLVALAYAGIGAPALGMVVYVGAAAMFQLPQRWALAVVGVAALLPPPVLGWRHGSSLSFAVALAALANFGVTRLAERNAELLAAHAEIRRLAVEQERARTARDLHDILGHSLTVIAVKAELAGRLLEVDAARAADEVADLERLARQALADVRHTVRAYREVTLAGELASARTALAAAGIEADLPATPDPLPPAHAELFGWAVREGVTNVVRHSGARRCVIRVAPDGVEVVDDGRGPAPDPSRDPSVDGGSGLRGLRERAEQLGARLSIGRADTGQGFRLRITLPQPAGEG